MALMLLLTGLNHWQTAILLLPLVLYFFFSAYRQALAIKFFKERFADQLETIKTTYRLKRFSWSSFFLQPSFGFRLSLALFLVTTATIIWF